MLNCGYFRFLMNMRKKIYKNMCMYFCSANSSCVSKKHIQTLFIAYSFVDYLVLLQKGIPSQTYKPF